MNRILLTLTLILTTVLSALSTYTVHSFSGNVTVRHDGHVVSPEKGMKLASGDEFNIGSGAWVEIYNAATKEIYKSTGQGKFTVMNIMLGAKKKSRNTVGAVNDRWSLAKKSDKGSTRLYTEGLVKRSMTVFDPEAENMEVEPYQLALHIFNTFTNPTENGKRSFPTEVTSTRLDGNGLNFSVTNQLAHPIYMNLVKINETALESIELSELGQPMGCYVLLPGQTISRGQLEGLKPGESHLLILTYCRFDIDNLIDETNKLLMTPPTDEPEASLPVFTGRL